LSQLKMTYFGAAAFKLVTPGGFKVLIDPYFEGNEHCRSKPDDFFDSDLVLVTHGAFDHLGDTVEILQNSQAMLIAGFDVCEYCKDSGVSPERLGQTVYGDLRRMGDILVRAVEARHRSAVQVAGALVPGVPFGYILTTDDGITVYHAGDTFIFCEMKLYRELYRPNILMIGISKIAEPYASELTPYEAALVTQWIGPDVVVPMHYPKGSDKLDEFYTYAKMLAPATAVVGDVENPYVYKKFIIESEH
jgi:L-ascorbate metabolism protein UlaG (beta-lactamase superfamily)